MDATLAPPEYDTLADLLRSLGDVAPDRVLWKPPPGTATEADVIRLVDGDRRPVEMIDNTLVEKVGGFREACAIVALMVPLYDFTRERRLGMVVMGRAPFRLSAATIRLPRLAYTAWATLPHDKAHYDSVAQFAPDLVVEIPCAENTEREMDRKRRDFFAAGTRCIWNVRLQAEAVDVYTSPDACVSLGVAETLSGEPVLPGFRLPLAEFFADPQVTLRPRACP